MKLAFYLWIVLVACVVNSFAGPNGTVANSPVIVVASTSTNLQTATDSTNEPVAPTHLDQQFTNSVAMRLVKAGNFWAGVYEVTQKEYQKVTGFNPSAFGGNTHPVDTVSYDDALGFCQKMTDLDVKNKAIPDGYHYDLPTEDEWNSLIGGATLDNAVTSMNGNVRTGTSDVGSLAPNSLGLYDVRGNVMEFVRTDDSKPYRVLKGGSWQDRIDVNVRPEFRWYAQPGEAKNNFGFRVVLRSK